MPTKTEKMARLLFKFSNIVLRDLEECKSFGPSKRSAYLRNLNSILQRFLLEEKVDFQCQVKIEGIENVSLYIPLLSIYAYTTIPLAEGEPAVEKVQIENFVVYDVLFNNIFWNKETEIFTNSIIYNTEGSTLTLDTNLIPVSLAIAWFNIGIGNSLILYSKDHALCSLLENFRMEEVDNRQIFYRKITEY